MLMLRAPMLFNWFVKVSLIGVLVFAATNQDMSQFSGKAMTGRAFTYPIAILVIPVAMYLIRRRNPAATYPHMVDALFGLPFLIDMAGNAANLYDTIVWWDDANHFVNWLILSLAFGLVLARFESVPWKAAVMTVGLGAIAGNLWEVAEYFTFVRNSPELATAYTDTLGDISLDMGGALVAALITAWVVARQHSRSDAEAAAGSAGKGDLSALPQ
jgi:hypothetical protein